eukprot:SAG22_NODE_664_length_8022_cov_2.639576_1_plen_113_part_10
MAEVASSTPPAAAAPAPAAEPPEPLDLTPEQKVQLHNAVIFLNNPQVKQAPLATTIKYMQEKLGLSLAGIKLALSMVYGKLIAEKMMAAVPALAVVPAGTPMPPAAAAAAAAA